MNRIRNIIENILCEKEAEEFAEWAWGDDFRDLNYKFADDLVHRWNERHLKNGLILSVVNSPYDDIPKMIEIWRKHENK